jgi:hypothetical protein
MSKVMVKKLARFAGVCLVLLLMSPSISFSQGQSPEAAQGHFFMVTGLKIPLGQVSEFMKYWQTVFVPLEKTDPDLISSTVLRHRIGPTDYTVFLIQEYKDMASIDSSRDREEGSLQKRAATDPDAAAAMKNFGKYVDGHVDYVLFAPNDVRK